MDSWRYEGCSGPKAMTYNLRVAIGDLPTGPSRAKQISAGVRTDDQQVDAATLPASRPIGVSREIDELLRDYLQR